MARRPVALDSGTVPVLPIPAASTGAGPIPIRAACPTRSRRARRPGAVLALLALLAVLSGTACAGPLPRAPESGYSPGSWEALARPRPQPLEGAATLAVERVEGVGVTESVGLAELILLRLLHRTDVVAVDRRRYSLASGRAARGLPVPPETPALGPVPEIEWLAEPEVGPETEVGRAISVRLLDAGTGEVRGAWTDTVARGTSTVTMARRLGTLLLHGLDAEGLLVDPAGYNRATRDDAAPRADFPMRPIAAPRDAFLAFMRGVVAEDRYDWADARAAYDYAARLGGPTFFEPREAMARVARLRAGGELAAS